MHLDQQYIFDGMMISDGHLSKNGKNARFRLSTKSMAFAVAFKDAIPELPWSDIRERNIFDKRTGKTYYSVRLDSKVSEYLTDQHNRWYNGREKIVPRDLVISPAMLTWWYLGDGHLNRKSSRPNYRRVELCTDSFTNHDRQWLVENLINIFGDNSIYIESQRAIIIAKTALVNMVSYLLPCPVSDYLYKYEFGQYSDKDYFQKSYYGRPLEIINIYRHKHKVRELNFEEVKKEIQL